MRAYLAPVDVAGGAVQAPAPWTPEELERLMPGGQLAMPPPTSTVAPPDQSGVAGQSSAGTATVSGGVKEQVPHFWRNAKGRKPGEPWLDFLLRAKNMPPESARAIEWRDWFSSMPSGIVPLQIPSS